MLDLRYCRESIPPALFSTLLTFYTAQMLLASHRFGCTCFVSASRYVSWYQQGEYRLVSDF
jgi:hypothetical protein